MAHFRSEYVSSRLKKSNVVLKEPAFSSVAFIIIVYLLTKHSAFGYLITKHTCAECGPLLAKGPQETTPSGAFGPQTTKGDGAPPPGYVHGDVLRNLNAFITFNIFADPTKWPERATEK